MATGGGRENIQGNGDREGVASQESGHGKGREAVQRVYLSGPAPFGSSAADKKFNVERHLLRVSYTIEFIAGGLFA